MATNLYANAIQPPLSEVTNAEEHIKWISERLASGVGAVHVYAIHAPAVGRIKIGRSWSVAERFNAIQTTSPTELVLLWSRPETELISERALHVALHSRRAHGEWFDIEPFELLKLVEGREVIPLDYLATIYGYSAEADFHARKANSLTNLCNSKLKTRRPLPFPEFGTLADEVAKAQ